MEHILSGLGTSKLHLCSSVCNGMSGSRVWSSLDESTPPSLRPWFSDGKAVDCILLVGRGLLPKVRKLKYLRVSSNGEIEAWDGLAVCWGISQNAENRQIIIIMYLIWPGNVWGSPRRYCKAFSGRGTYWNTPERRDFAKVPLVFDEMKVKLILLIRHYL